MCDPVGVVEVAARLNVTRSAVNQWRVRNIGFPPPRWLVGNRPAWDWSDVRQWAQDSGRSWNWLDVELSRWPSTGG